MVSTNAQFNPRGKNTVIECLQFGGNREFWDSFASSEAIRRYFYECYAYVVGKIGFLRTDENIICAAIITESVRRNLFVWYVPITEKWTSKVGGLTSYSDLQEDFYNKISSNYGAERGESKSLFKNTNAEQARRFSRAPGDRYDEPPPYDDLPY